MSVGRQFVLQLTRQAARDLGCRIWSTDVLMFALLQACREDAMSAPAAGCFDTQRLALADELDELRDLVRRTGIDPDHAAEFVSGIWRADRSPPWSAEEPRIRPHTQTTLVFSAAVDIARADPRAATADGEPDYRAVHLFLAALEHPTGTVHKLMHDLGTDLATARQKSAFPL
ncbi:Clp protease N-terminal domain-containing protein [Nocardia sp. NPDC058666]|uniref:Clp protease N-terminal domain-containing protein n=1 Tax=Nocardia sp. NPDC058666 TaxID=3346587 RepID=UPI003656797E